MTIRHERDALANGIIDVRREESGHGGHSWGYAYVDDDGDFHTEHGLGTMPDDMDVPVTDNALVHTRLATRGEVNIENAHPFKVHDDDNNVVAMMAHNGTWRRAPDDDLYSDTWFMARALESYVQEKDDFEAALEATADKIGETMVVLHESGDAYVYAGRFSITKKRAGVIASSGGDRISRGEIAKVEGDSYTRVARLDNHTLREYARL